MSLDQKRVHAGSAVSDNRIIEHLDTANLRIDCNDSGVCGISKDARVVRLMSGSGRQTGRLHVGRKVLWMVVPGASDLREFDAALGAVDTAVPDLDVAFIALKEMGADDRERLGQEPAGFGDRAASRHHRTRGVSAGAGGRTRCVAEPHRDLAGINSEHLMRDLCEYRLVALPVRM